MAQYKAPPLRPIVIRGRPLNTHAIDWSCDGDLVVAADDALHVFMPHFTESTLQTKDRTRHNNMMDEGGDDESAARPQYYSSPLRIMATRILDPRMNAGLLAGKDARVAEADCTFANGYGHGAVTGFGGALNQITRVEWSPSGMGVGRRPILTAGLTRGAVVAWGDSMHSSRIALSDGKTRGFEFWRALWGIGTLFELPDATCPTGFSATGDYIKSFSWAGVLAPGQGLLGYLTDSADLVILAIQYVQAGDFVEADSNFIGEPKWKIDEVARLSVPGPHVNQDVHDPNYTPSNSVCSIKWSPWLTDGDDALSKTAALGYLAPHFIAARQITIDGPWQRGRVPKIRVSSGDILGICCHLGPGAFMKWEDAVGASATADSKQCRGMVATPFVVKMFQATLNTAPFQEVESHGTGDCNSSYPDLEEQSHGTNPITGIIMHRLDTPEIPEVPIYSLVRMSATALNDSWFQHNLPPSEEYADQEMPAWADYIRRRIAVRLPEVMAYSSLDYGHSSEDEEEEEEEGAERDDGDDFDDFVDFPDAAGTQVSPWRIRIWGLVASPGRGASAVLLSEHDTVRPDRRCRLRVIFAPAPPSLASDRPTSSKWKQLSAEGQAWEWMYGGGPEIDGFPTQRNQAKLFDLFRATATVQVCPLCKTKLDVMGQDFVCSNNHGVARCCASGMPILRPNISRICGLCGNRNMATPELERIAKELHGDGVELEISPDLCNGCRGKYIV